MINDYQIEVVQQNQTTIRFRIKKDNQFLTFREVFELWSSNETFIKFYKNELIKMNFKAFYWEHPALKKEYLEKNYECLIEKSSILEGLPLNKNAFKDYIYNNEEVACFMNLGNTARLVVPTKKTENEIYNHFGKFIRFADENQIIAVFKCIGQTITQEIERQKVVWLSTAGLGVIWLHIRMDIRPKYYKTIAYKTPDFLETIT